MDARLFFRVTAAPRRPAPLSSSREGRRRKAIAPTAASASGCLARSFGEAHLHRRRSIQHLRPRGRGLTGRAASTSSDEDVDLDPYLALSLAGHAFFAYKEPKRPLLRHTIGGTEVDLLDKNFVLREFIGRLSVNSVAVTFADEEATKGDVFFGLSVGDDVQNTGVCAASEPGEPRACDEPREFLVRAGSEQRLQIRVWRKRFLRPDELLGVCMATLESGRVSEGVSLELPLRGGVAEGTVTASVSWTLFAFDEGEDEDSSAMVLDLIGVEEGPLLHTAFRPACFCSNPETDTQFWIWWNEADREVLLSFRGTEQTQWKDLLTDVKVLPTSVNAEGVTSTAIFANIGDEVMAHNGFLSAYLSVRTAILALLKTLTSSRGDGPWTFYVTGHSLGGALATIFAYECAELKMGEVVVYTYGSPRVGNAAFVESFHRLVGSSWRFSNASDIIPTVPRFLGYRHVDKSCRIEEDGSVMVEEDKDALGEKDILEILGASAEDLPEVEELLQKELSLLSTLMDGKALEQHMEDNYLSNLLILAQALKESPKGS